MRSREAGALSVSRFGLAVLPLLWCLGCTPPRQGAAPAAQVSGTVMMDGKALPTGELHFSVPGFPPSVLEITDGKYAGEAPIGKNEVQLYVFVEGPPLKKYGGQRLKTNTSPKKYWGPETSLEATVAADGANKFDFNLSSK